jgi:hypothetical protein
MTIRRAVIGGLLTCLFMVVEIVICMRPYDDRDLRQLLTGGCDMPCFAGVIPGETYVREAVEQLAQDRTIESQVEYRLNNRNRYFLVNWSGFLFDPFQQAGQMVLDHTSIPEEVPADDFYVRWKQAPSLGDVYLGLGVPERVDVGFWYHDLGTRVSAILRLRYGGGRLVVYTRHLCPVAYRTFWTTPVMAVRYSAEPLAVLQEASIEYVQRLKNCR